MNKIEKLIEEFENKTYDFVGDGGFHLGCYECDDGQDRNEMIKWLKEKLSKFKD